MKLERLHWYHVSLGLVAIAAPLLATGGGPSASAIGGMHPAFSGAVDNSGPNPRDLAAFVLFISVVAYGVESWIRSQFRQSSNR